MIEGVLLGDIGTLPLTEEEEEGRKDVEADADDEWDIEGDDEAEG